MNINLDTPRYLHIEFGSKKKGNYVYGDNTPRFKITTLKDLNNECLCEENISIPISSIFFKTPIVQD